MAFIPCDRCDFEVEVYRSGRNQTTTTGDWLRWVSICPEKKGYSGPISGEFDCPHLKAAINRAEQEGRF